MEESLQQMCRTCLMSGVSLVSLLELSSTYTFAEMLTKCTNVTVTENDPLPKKVCPNCISEIERSYFFKIKCESSQDILQQYVELQAATDQLDIPKTEQTESTENIVLDSDIGGLTIIQALEIETRNQHKVVYKDLAEILADEEIRVPEKPVENDNIPMGKIKNEVLDEQRQGSLPNHDLEEILQDSNVNDDQMDESGQQRVVILYCEKCCKTFENMEEYDSHSGDCDKVQMVNGKIIMRTMGKCPHCPPSRNYFANVEKHISTCHSSQKATETTENDPPSSQENGKRDDCPKSHDEDEEVIHRVQMPKGENVRKSLRKCSHCPTYFVKKKSWENHISKCHLSQNASNSLSMSKLACRQCGTKFSSDKSYLYHMKIGCTAQQFVCKICGKVFIDDKYLIDHLKTHENKNKDSLKKECRLCGKGFIMLSTLKAHLRIHNGETPFLCSICGKKFFVITSLKQHVMRHENNKPYECNQCGSFVSIAKFFTHFRNHTGEHPFVCNICKAPFRLSASLEKHYLVRHNLVRPKQFLGEELPYACDICSKRFAERDTLKTHQLNHIKERRFQCSFCPQWYYQRYHYLIHMANHGKDKEKQSPTVVRKDSEADDQEIIEIKVEDDEIDS